MLRLKSCPRCKGDIRLDRDYYGWYEECIQCGYTHDLESIAEAETSSPAGKNKRHNVLRRGSKWER